MYAQTRGGGNCANALTAAARLGLDSYLVSKVGDDSIGQEIEQELLSDGVHTQFLLRAKGHSSPFTYIIVDKQGGTRTCIHTPGAAYSPQDLTQDTISQALADAQLVYFDGRLTESAVMLARAARQQGVPVLVEAERLRPNLEVLLGEADYVCTSAHFPQQWTGETALGDALHTTLSRLPRVKFMITTLGKRGSVLIARTDSQAVNQEVAQEAAQEASQEAVLEDLLHSMLDEVGSSNRAGDGNGIGDGDGSSLLGCTARNGTRVKAGRVTATDKPFRLQLQRSPGDSPEATAAAEKAASAEASANADSTNASAYGRTASTAVATAGRDLIATVTVASAANLPQEAVEDTTGAGDAFIGTILYGIIHKLLYDQMLRLAAVVAACKCTALGARPGLPHAEDIDADLLTA